MKSRRLSIPLAIFVLLTCASIAFFIFFGRHFPPQMAVHFNLSGGANGYMDRVKFIVLGSFLSFMVPALIATAVGVVPRVLPPSMVNIPNKDYWMAPERRAQAFDLLLWFGLWQAIAMQAFLLVVDVAIYRANLAQTPRLEAAGFVILLGALLLPVFLITWTVRLFNAFQIPRANLR